MVPSGILVSITTREARGGLLVTFGTLLHLYGTIVFWLYVEQLTLVELFYHINVFIVVPLHNQCLYRGLTTAPIPLRAVLQHLLGHPGLRLPASELQPS